MTINFNEVWTETRVGRLTELWAKGWSASQIARDLEGYITRNAVISKIHRLKLPVPDSKNSKMARSHVIVRQAPPAPPPVTSEGRLRNVTRLQAKANGHDPVAPRRRNPSNSIAAAIAIADSEPGLPERLKGEAPDGTGIKLMQLTPTSCRWPRGNPTEPDFEFCGDEALPDLPYCLHHAALAYQPPKARVRYDKFATGGADINS
jgi:GcrA cell cycle regulator